MASAGDTELRQVAVAGRTCIPGHDPLPVWLPAGA